MRAVVVMVNVVVIGVVPLGVTEFGEAVHVEAPGRPLHATLTAALNPKDGVTVTVKLAELPATMVPEAGVAAIAKSEPAPAIARVCGLLGALSVSLSDPEAVPAAVGAKTTLITHVACGTRLAPQVFVSVNAPLAEMPLMVRLAVPELATVAV